MADQYGLPDLALIQGDVLPVEEALIGCVLLEPKAAIPPLSPDEFWPEHHRTIWRAILDLAGRGVTPDIVAVAYELRRAGEIEAAGGDVALALAAERACLLTQTHHYAELVRSAARERMKRQLGVELAKQGLSDEEILRRLEDMPRALSGPLFDPAQNWRAIVKAWETGRILTGYRALDDLNGGYGLGDFVVVGGRTSHGKSSWLCQLALRFAEQGVEVVYLTLEESTDAIVRRLIANLSGISMRRLKDGTVSGEEFHEAEEAVRKIQALPLTVTGVDHVGSLAEDAVLAAASTATGRVLLVDHLQQITTRDQSRAYGLERVVKRFQGVALRDSRVVILASQLNRETEQRQGPPRISDLRDTGAIEFAARQILLVYWPCKHDAERHESEYEVYLAKQSDGGTGLVTLRFEPWCGRFVENTP